MSAWCHANLTAIWHCAEIMVISDSPCQQSDVWSCHGDLTTISSPDKVFLVWSAAAHLVGSTSGATYNLLLPNSFKIDLISNSTANLHSKCIKWEK